MQIPYNNTKVCYPTSFVERGREEVILEWQAPAPGSGAVALGFWPCGKAGLKDKGFCISAWRNWLSLKWRVNNSMPRMWLCFSRSLLINTGSVRIKEDVQSHACTLMFTEALVTIAKRWKQPQSLSIDELINKMWYVHEMKYYSAIKK